VGVGRWNQAWQGVTRDTADSANETECPPSSVIASRSRLRRYAPRNDSLGRKIGLERLTVGLGATERDFEAELGREGRFGVNGKIGLLGGIGVGDVNVVGLVASH